MLLASVVAGIGLSAIDPKDLESSLRLGDSQARFEKEKDWTLMRGVTGQGEVGKGYEHVSVLGRFRWKRRVLIAVGQVFLPVFTVGAGLATFRHRRARSRQALRHIGVLTTAVAAIFVVFWLLSEFTVRYFYTIQPGLLRTFGTTRNMSPIGGPFAYLDSIWWDLGQSTGLAIAALWLVLALGSRWRTAPDWMDRLGRLIGAGWIASTVVALLLMYALMSR
jgi:hypothetical protein